MDSGRRKGSEKVESGKYTASEGKYITPGIIKLHNSSWQNVLKQESAIRGLWAMPSLQIHWIPPKEPGTVHGMLMAGGFTCAKAGQREAASAPQPGRQGLET